jgi:TetR/AcrR family transcriptional regulator, cholesterol catabolism regulator
LVSAAELAGTYRPVGRILRHVLRVAQQNQGDALTPPSGAGYKRGAMPARVLTSPLLTRRAEICRTAAQIFRERGYDATSVSDIARALGITKAGLYHYFESKEALLFEITAYGLDRVRDDVIAPVKGLRDPEERLRQLVIRHACIATHGRGAIAQLVDEVRALPPANRKLLEERMRSYFDLVRDTLKELRAQGRLRNVDPTVATFGLIGTILWLPRWFRQNGRLSQEQVAHQIADIALGGLLKTSTAPKKKRRTTQPSGKDRRRRTAKVQSLKSKA